MPYLEYHIDSSASVDIEEVAILGQTSAFHPLDLTALPQEEGITWLRFTLAPLQPDLHPETYLLDMGASVPGKPLLYVPLRNELSGALEWRENAPAQRNILLMPEQARSPLTCYIRLEGLPGPWFNPMIRSPQNAAANWGNIVDTGSMLALAVVFLLCLLRGMQENGQWRIWTGLFVLFSLIQAIVGMPTYGSSFSLHNMLAIMTPGLALMTLPHVGRHLLKTPAWSRSLDIQLFILSILGAMCALVPLIPGLNWINRWLELWPILIAAFLPTALGLWISGLRGSRCFLLACLMPPLFTAFAWIGREFGFAPDILASLPSWGVALCALLLISLPVNSANSKENKKQKKTPPDFAPDPAPEIINLDHPLDDPSLRLLPTNAPIDQPFPVAHASAAETHVISYPKALASKEGILRHELDSLLRETASLSQCALPPATRVYAEKIIKSAETLTRIVTEPDFRSPQDDEKELVEDNFNLQSIIRSVHDQAAPIAEHAGLSLSWYMPPFLSHEYQGDSTQLEYILSLLVDSAIRGTSKGTIKLSVRRVPESEDPGHLLFTVSDTGDGAPPLHRSAVALAKAWELSSRYRGFLGLESGPGGLSIAFSAHFRSTEKRETMPQKKIQIIITGSKEGIRSELAQMAEKTAFAVSEVNSLNEALKKQHSSPVNLLVVSDEEAKPASGDIIGEFIKIGNEAGYKNVYILAITKDESQWKLLKASGFTHAMLEPVDLEAFKKTIISLVDSSSTINSGKKTEEPQINSPENAAANNAEIIIDLMDSFYNQSSNIVTEKKPMQTIGANFKPEKAPQMMDQQDFDLSSGFEGPSWLLDETESVGAPDARRNSDSENNANAMRQDSQPAEQINDPKVSEMPHPLENVEISEPVAIISTFQPHYNPTEKNSDLQKEDVKNNISAPAQQDHVSESPVSAASGETRQKTTGNNSVMDFIVSVQTTRGEAEESKLEPRNEKLSPDPENSTRHKEAEPDAEKVISRMLIQLDGDLKKAQDAYNNHNCVKVEEVTASMATMAEDYGYRIVGRLARCVERAARAKDLPALGDLLPVLADAVERNRIAAAQKK